MAARGSKPVHVQLGQAGQRAQRLGNCKGHGPQIHAVHAVQVLQQASPALTSDHADHMLQHLGVRWQACCQPPH